MRTIVVVKNRLERITVCSLVKIDACGADWSGEQWNQSSSYGFCSKSSIAFTLSEPLNQLAISNPISVQTIVVSMAVYAYVSLHDSHIRTLAFVPQAHQPVIASTDQLT